MKAVLLVVGFVVFVAALIVGARFLDAPAPVAPGAVPVKRESAPHGRTPRAGQQNQQNPALPALFVQKNNVDATPIALAGARDKPMLLHIWASWCGPCVQELPGLLELGRKGRYTVMAVSVDDRWPDVVRFFGGTDRIPPEITWDPKVTLEPTLGVRSLPATFLVDSKGIVVARYDGAHDWSDAALVADLERAVP
jgi:thiol-disulfide isomerase/thioredoxin